MRDYFHKNERILCAYLKSRGITGFTARVPMRTVPVIPDTSPLYRMRSMGPSVAFDGEGDITPDDSTMFWDTNYFFNSQCIMDLIEAQIVDEFWTELYREGREPVPVNIYTEFDCIDLEVTTTLYYVLCPPSYGPGGSTADDVEADTSAHKRVRKLGTNELVFITPWEDADATT